jgi:hypothetical protein
MRIIFRLLLLAVILFPAAGTALGQTVTCSSDDGERHYCTADTRYGAHLVRQTSKAPCTEATTWGYDEEGIWVDKGCAGEFAAGSPEKGDEEPASGQTVVCTSENGARKYCPAETRGNVQLVKESGDALCVQGTSWGFDTHGVWVNKGCKAEFVVGVPKHPAPQSKMQRVTCRSDNGRKNYCDADTRGAQVQLARQLGPAPCDLGASWGYDKQGIWVDRGCWGEFVVQKSGGAGELSCNDSIGKKKAKELVERCVEVSSATHAPCNAQNACILLEEEIRGGCKLIGAGAPAFCAEYK